LDIQQLGGLCHFIVNKSGKLEIASKPYWKTKVIWIRSLVDYSLSLSLHCDKGDLMNSEQHVVTGHLYHIPHLAHTKDIEHPISVKNMFYTRIEHDQKRR
jgi:hypothetical protein